MFSFSEQRLLGLVALCGTWHTTTAFSPLVVMSRNMRPPLLLHLAVDNKQEPQQQRQEQEQAIECFIVNFFEVEQQGATPHVVCTSQPDEYAWFNGIERHDMVETDGILPGALECVEGASPRGFPEWECTQTETESSWQ